MNSEINFYRRTFYPLKGKTYSAKTWVMATGSSPSIPPIQGLDKTPYITNREIYSLDHLPESMIILGAGPIAIEMPQASTSLGTKVYVIQRSGHILTKEDKEMADILMYTLRDEEATFYLNSRVIQVKDLGKEREISFQCRDEQISLRTETLLVALGREANLQGMGLEGISRP